MGKFGKLNWNPNLVPKCCIFWKGKRCKEIKKGKQNRMKLKTTTYLSGMRLKIKVLVGIVRGCRFQIVSSEGWPVLHLM